MHLFVSPPKGQNILSTFSKTMPSFFTLFFLLLNISTLASAATTANITRPFNKIYAFGDSYTDTGNTGSATAPSGFSFVSSPPYGNTFFHHPTNRYSDGRLVIDFVAEKLSLPYLPAYRDTKADKSSGVNFAVAGSTAIEHKFFEKNNMTLNITPQSLQTQLYWFKKFLAGQGCVNMVTTPNQCKALFGEALVWVGEIGANDYAYTIGSPITGNIIQQLALKRTTNFVLALLNMGAKYVVVQGLPPTGCLTLAMYLSGDDDRDDIGCTASVNRESYSHNTIYQAKLEEFRKQFPDAVIVYADYWNAYHTIMKNPTQYGFKELYKVCCGSSGGKFNFNIFGPCGSPSSTSCSVPSQYINWDGVHLTEGMYKVVSDMFINGPFTHPPFDYLLKKKMQIR